MVSQDGIYGNAAVPEVLQVTVHWLPLAVAVAKVYHITQKKNGSGFEGTEVIKDFFFGGKVVV
jgi:hypothetical protein